MNQFGSLDFAWTQGYNGQPVYYITNEVLCFKCGKHIKFLDENATRSVFWFPGKGIGPFATHKINRKFAIAEHCLNPKIYVYNYPSMEKCAELEGGAEVEFQTVEFSSSIYLLSLSGVPDFLLAVWDYEKRQKLTSVTLPDEPLCEVSFNPANWRHICVSTRVSLNVWHIEQNSETCIILPHNVLLPPEDEPERNVFEEKKPVEKRGSTLAKFAFTMSATAIAGLYGEMVDHIADIEDKIVRVSPVSQAWTPAGDIFVGGDKGHLLKVQQVTGGNYRAKVVYYPGTLSACSSAASSTVSISTSSRKSDMFQGGWDKSLFCLGLHQLGLFGIREDGRVRVFDVSKEMAVVANTYNIGHPLTSLAFSTSYLNLALGSPKGLIFEMKAYVDSSVNTLMDTHYGEFVGLGVLAASANVCVTIRDNGMLQMWSADNGQVLSSLRTGELACSLACSPVAQFAVMGSVDGYVYFVDCTNVDSPRLVHRIRLYYCRLRVLEFDQDGRYLFTGSNDRHVFVLDGRPSRAFTPIGYVVVNGWTADISAINDNSTVKVAVAVTTSKHKKPHSDCIVRFDISDALLEDLKGSYVDIKCEFKAEAVKKMTFTLSFAFNGIVIGQGNRAYTVCHLSGNIRTLTFPDELPQQDAQNQPQLTPDGAIPGHQLPSSHILMSPHLKWLASFSLDGAIMLRSVANTNQTLKVQPFGHSEGGVLCAAFSHDCRNVYAFGQNGLLCCYKCSLAAEGELAQNEKSDLEKFDIHRSQLLEGVLGVENKVLSEMDTWKFPPPLTRTPSAIEVDDEILMRSMKKEAMEKEEVYTSPPPTLPPNSTWLGEKEFETFQEEKNQYAAVKTKIRKQIIGVRQTIISWLRQNEELPDIQKLARSEFLLDIEEQTRLQLEEAAEIQNLSEEILSKNANMCYARDLLKEECWDNMLVKGRSLQAFNSERNLTNFPLKARSRENLSRLNIVTKQRLMEVRELQDVTLVKEERNQGYYYGKKPPNLFESFDMLYSCACWCVVCPYLLWIHPRQIRKKEVDMQHLLNESSDLLDEMENEDSKNDKEHPSITGGLGNFCGGRNKLFYSQFELNLRHQKIRQIIFLEDSIYRVKETFNKAFDEVYVKKEHCIAQIQEKNKRIVSIFKSLEISEPLVQPQWSLGEKPEQLLVVLDHEIKAEKCLSPSELKQLEKERKAEEERLLKQQEDNQRQRALDSMMGGVLEIRREDELKKDIPVPAFMQQKEKAEWTEEERKLSKEYKIKVKELNEEREKFRKQLDAELRKLQKNIAEIMSSFDETLNELFQRKITVTIAVFQEQLKIQRLRSSLLKEEELMTWENELTFRVDREKARKNDVTQMVTDCYDLLEDLQGEYDVLLAEDKLLEKSFRREFNDVSPSMADQLLKQFRKRPRVQKYRYTLTAVTGGKNPNPFADRPSTAKQAADTQTIANSSLNEMDRESHMPEGCEPSVWRRLCRFRRTKFDSENKIKQKLQMMTEAQTFMQKRQAEMEAIKNELDDLRGQIAKLKEDQQRYSLDVEVQLLMMQGQVEVSPVDYVHDYHDCILVSRSVVQDLNNIIEQLGEEKFAHMEESKDYRKGIIQLEWEHKKLSMERDDLENKLKDIQFVKVTRAVQAYLRESDYAAKKAKDIATLEQTMELQKKYHQKRLEENRRSMNEMKKTMTKREVNNSVKDPFLTELNVSFHERRYIGEIIAKHNVDVSVDMRYGNVLQRRKLVELARTQTQEIEVLKKEVIRLRLRNYPALFSCKH